MGDIAWETATWLNRPPKVRTDGSDLLVTTGPATDFWRTTGYGYVRDTGHALLTEFPVDSAVEVGYVAQFDELYDQAGLLVRVDPSAWVKAGTELTDGAAEEVRIPSRVSIRYLANVAAWSELPRAQVTTARAASCRNFVPSRCMRSVLARSWTRTVSAACAASRCRCVASSRIPKFGALTKSC